MFCRPTAAFRCIKAVFLVLIYAGTINWALALFPSNALLHIASLQRFPPEGCSGSHALLLLTTGSFPVQTLVFTFRHLAALAEQFLPAEGIAQRHLYGSCWQEDDAWWSLICVPVCAHKALLIIQSKTQIHLIFCHLWQRQEENSDICEAGTSDCLTVFTWKITGKKWQETINKVIDE